MTADSRLIIPLDLPTTDEARAMVERLGDAVSFYKIGLELLASDGMALDRNQIERSPVRPWISTTSGPTPDCCTWKTRSFAAIRGMT